MVKKYTVLAAGTVGKIITNTGLFLFRQWLVILFIFGGVGAQAQSIPQLTQIAQKQTQVYTSEYTAIRTKARKLGWVTEQMLPNGGFISLQGVTLTGQPIYYETYTNAISAATTNTQTVWAGGSAGLSLNGSHPALAGKLGIWDGGAIRATHQEFGGRIVNRDGATQLSDHATHVAGTMMAAGISPDIKGMAPGMVNLQSWNFANDVSEIAAAASSLLVSNHSYGHLAGWRLVGSNWYWYGELSVSDTEDVYYGYYNSTAKVWDDIAYFSPYYLPVKAAGNSRNSGEPAIGQIYYRYNPQIGQYEPLARTAEMKSYTGYDVIPDHSVAKNILTVGAINGLPLGYKTADEVSIFYNSSWGPTDDGRIKPDLVAAGVRVLSTFGYHDSAYAHSTGTSMAAPNVAGSLILLQEHFTNLHPGKFMLAATIKGLAIHTTQEAGTNPGPDYIHGWGVLNVQEAAQVLSNPSQRYMLAEDTLINAQVITRTVRASGNEPLRVTISWTDPSGTVLPLEPATLNNRSPRLVHDLDVRVSLGNTTHQPWVLNPDLPALPATRGDNFRDNVEQILIPQPEAGKLYTIRISHKNNLRQSQQPFALIVSGLAPGPDLSLPVNLLSFRAERQKEGVLLSWETATEINAAGMQVQVSANARDFRNLGFVAATGNNQPTRQKYTYQHQNPAPGIQYYRLQQLDLDGTFVYSGIRAVNTPLAPAIKAWPNPFRDQFTLALHSEVAATLELEIRNHQGQTIYQRTSPLLPGDTEVPVQLPDNLAAGMYLVLIRYQQQVHALKLIKK